MEYYGGEALVREASEVFEKGNSASNMVISFTVHTPGDNLQAISVATIDIEQDFQSAFTDVMHITSLFPPSVYIQKIYPNAVNLEATLKIGYADSTGSIKEEYKERFKAVLVPHENMAPADYALQGVAPEDIDKKGPIAVTLQLLNRTAEIVRLVMISGCFSSVSAESLLKGCLSYYGNSFTIDGKDPLPGVDVYPPNNQKVYDRIVIPFGTSLVKLPYRLQKDMIGIYTTGIGSYIKQHNGKQTWFVYPLYDTTRYDKENYLKMVVFNVSPRRLPAADKTYLVNGNTLYVVTTDNIKYHNNQELNLINDGSGFRLPEASYFMRKPVEMTPNGPIGHRREINTEAIIRERLDGIQYAPRSERYISSNSFAEFSKNSKSNVAIISFVWEHSRTDLIYPGMPLKLVTGKNVKDKGLKGIILKVNTLINTSGTTFQSGYGVGSSLITAAVEIDKKLEI